MARPAGSGTAIVGDPTKPKSGAAVPFREIVPPPDHPRCRGVDKCNAITWTEGRMKIPEPAWLINRLKKENLDQPYVGFTSDGEVKEGVWKYAEDEGAPVEEMTKAAKGVVGLMTEEEKKRTIFPGVEDDEIRIWSNPELYVNPGGIRLDDATPEMQTAIHNLLKASFSPEGYDKVLGCCLTNAFLGHLVNGKKVLNEHSYNFRLFGTPSTTEPWGYSFFGHHLCLTVVVVGKRMVIGPTFMGAEPDRIDEGPHKGLRLFKTEELESLNLMQSLSPELQAKATLSVGMDGQSLPEDRWNPFDERHLGGAKQDNRVVPFEGCPVKLFPAAQKEQIFKLFKAFNEYYPHSVLEHRLKNFKDHLDETYFAWIGPHGDEDPYYFRIHSPVAFMEHDFHCGIFLTNTSPARCHIHDVNRLPNRGDYGKALLAQWKKEKGA